MLRYHAEYCVINWWILGCFHCLGGARRRLDSQTVRQRAGENSTTYMEYSRALNGRALSGKVRGARGCMEPHGNKYSPQNSRRARRWRYEALESTMNPRHHTHGTMAHEKAWKGHGTKHRSSWCPGEHRALRRGKDLPKGHVTRSRVPWRLKELERKHGSP